jgi:gentisate 1,2-dioxygenase
MATAFFEKPGTSAERLDFYRRLDRRNTAPLWEVLGELVTPQPQTACAPALWRYEEIRPLLMEAGGLITALEAERRVVVLENPGLRGASQITQTLYAGLQLVLPGEFTAGHRHAAAALRFVLESKGGYTAVNGERTIMQPGDFILTPSWTWHDHGNPGDEPVIWLDGLDIPLVNTLGASFAEHDSLEYESNLPAPVFSYPWSRSREALDRLYRNSPLDSHHGVKLRYVNPATGGDPMPTIGAFLQLLPAGFKSETYRATDSTVYCCMEGNGQSRIGDQVMDWGRHDIFVVPSWYPVSHEAAREAVLFGFSDRPVQQALGLWRERR